jgi:hypothetical protein
MQSQGERQMNKNIVSSNDPAPGDDRAIGQIQIQVQSASTIETELALRMESVVKSIQSLEKAQQITQDSLQLEVCV